MTEKSLSDMRIGFCGLGLMGRPMCRHLHRAGARLTLWNRTRRIATDLASELSEASAEPEIRVVDQPAAAAGVDIVILMLADTKAVEEVLFGGNGVASGIAPGSLLVDMGTTAVAATCEFAQRLAALGVGYVDAPVSGGEVAAVDGSLVIMTGGSGPSLERVSPVFSVLGRQVTQIGDVGAGQVAKAANQVIVGLNIGAVAEALLLAEAAGVDPARVREALLGGFAASRVLEVHGQRMIDGTFAPGGKVRTQHKDMDQACELAASLGRRLPATELGRELFRQAMAEGDADLDHSALIRTLRDF